MKKILRLSIIFVLPFFLGTNIMADSTPIKDYLFKEKMEGAIPVFIINYDINAGGQHAAGEFGTILKNTATISSYNEINGSNLEIRISTPKTQIHERGEFLFLEFMVIEKNGEAKVILSEGKMGVYLNGKPALLQSGSGKNIQIQISAEKVFIDQQIAEMFLEKNS